MKLKSELNKKDTVKLYCHMCKSMRQLLIVDIDKNGILLQCPTCKKDSRIPFNDYIEKESEREIEYKTDKLEQCLKVGQNLFHPVFNDTGVIVSKTKSVICVDFAQSGLKMLALDIFKKQ